jgi:hypothetical protein
MNICFIIFQKYNNLYLNIKNKFKNLFKMTETTILPETQISIFFDKLTFPRK